MAITEEFKPAAEAISKALRRIESMMTPVGSMHFWYARAASSLALLAGGDNIEYVTGRYLKEEATAEIVVLTRRLVLRAHAAGTETLDLVVSAMAYPRASITAVGISAEEGVNSDPNYSEWPGKVELTLVVRDLSLKLPLQRSYAEEEPQALLQILQTELERLGESRAAG